MTSSPINRPSWKNNNRRRPAAALFGRAFSNKVSPHPHCLPWRGPADPRDAGLPWRRRLRCGVRVPDAHGPEGGEVARVGLGRAPPSGNLVAVEVLLNVIEPFHRFVGAGMMTDLRYLMKTNTVPVWSVPIIAGIGPMIIFTIVYIRNRNSNDLHHAILGILFAVLITGVLTDAIKDAVGRPRPDFFWRCFPDGNAVYDKITTEVICHGHPSVIKEGHKSFPSGHTSWSFAGLGFLSWYLAGKITVFDRRGHAAKLCVVLMPLLLAAMIAISRVDDYWHHWQDVCTGGLLGMVVASVCYLQFFPAPSDEKGFWPHAHFRFITERESESQTRRSTEMMGSTSAAASAAWHGGQMGRQTSQALDALEAVRGGDQ